MTRCPHCNTPQYTDNPHTDYPNGLPYTITTDEGTEDETTVVTVTDPFGETSTLTVAADDSLIDGLNTWLGTFRRRAVTFACEVDDCDRRARECGCGAAHCDIHPHIWNEA